MSNSQSENGTKRRETSEVFDSKTIVPQPRRGAIANDDATDRVHVKEEQLLEKGGDGNAGKMSDKLPVRAKEDVSSQSQEASVTPGALESPSAFDQFPTDVLEPVGFPPVFKVQFPKTVGGGAKGKSK